MPKKNIEKENKSMNAFENEPKNDELGNSQVEPQATQPGEWGDTSNEGGSLMDDFANAGQGVVEGDETMSMDTSDVYDEVVLPTGSEVKVRVHSVNVGTNNSGGTYWRLQLEEVNDPHIKRITHFLSFIGPEDDARRKNNVKKAFMAFKAAFGYAENEAVSKNGLIGRTGWAILRKDQSEEYGEQNSVQRWILPKTGAGGLSGFGF